MYVCTTSQMYLAIFNFFLFLLLKVLFLMKQVKHRNGCIYYTRYKSSSVTFTLI